MSGVNELTIEDKANLFDKILDIISIYKKSKKKKTNEKEKKEINIPFNDFWEKYDKKYLYPAAAKEWNKLTDEERMIAYEYIETYKKSIYRNDVGYLYQVYPNKYISQKYRLNEIKSNCPDYTILENFDKGMRTGKQEEMKKELGESKYIEIKNEWKNSSLYV